jgi:hypothetical protein
MTEKQAEIIIRVLGSIRNTVQVGFLVLGLLLSLLILRQM